MDREPWVVDQRRRFDGRSATAKVVAIVVILALILSSCPRGKSGSGKVRSSSVRINLRQIGLALLSYQDDFGSFPPAYVADFRGTRYGVGESWCSQNGTTESV